MVLANLVHSRLDRFGDGGAGTLCIGTDLTVPAAESDSRRQFTAEPVDFRPGLGGTGQVMAALGVCKRGAQVEQAMLIGHLRGRIQRGPQVTLWGTRDVTAIFLPPGGALALAQGGQDVEDVLFLAWRVQEDSDRAQPSDLFEVTGSTLVGQGPIITLFAKEVFSWRAGQTGLGRCPSSAPGSAGFLV